MGKAWDISPNDSIFLFDEVYNVVEAESKAEVEAPATIYPAVVLIREEETPERVSFLSKIMQSVGVNLNECQTVFGTSDYTSETPQSKIVLSFGTKTPNPTNYESLLMDEITFWQFDELDQIQNNTSLKRKLWECLKIAFPESQK